MCGSVRLTRTLFRKPEGEPLLLCPAGAGAKSALKVKVQDGPELYVCRLSEGRQDFANLDLVLDEYTEFTVEGAALHITGAVLRRYAVRCASFTSRYKPSLLLRFDSTQVHA